MAGKKRGVGVNSPHTRKSRGKKGKKKTILLTSEKGGKENFCEAGPEKLLQLLSGGKNWRGAGGGWFPYGEKKKRGKGGNRLE